MCYLTGGLQFGSTAFESRLSYGGGGGGGGGSAHSDDPNPGGRGGNGGGLVYLQLDELTLDGKILAEGEIINSARGWVKCAGEGMNGEDRLCFKNSGKVRIL